MLMQSFPLHLVHSDRSRLAFANGQYILIRRTAYDAAGGHEAVRDRFVEDIGLAQRVKALGLRSASPWSGGSSPAGCTPRSASSSGAGAGSSTMRWTAPTGRLLVRLLDVLVSASRATWRSGRACHSCSSAGTGRSRRSSSA